MPQDEYICQLITNNINETGTNHISSEVLEAIHLFLEEFIDHLMKSAISFDISHLKSTTLELLSQNLGKQLLVEAEIELKQQQQENATYSEAFYTQKLALQRTFEKYRAFERNENNENSGSVEITPVVVIYVTSIVEHMAEYILNLVVAGGDAEDIGIKEVYDTLLEDRQLTHLFQKMNLKEHLERGIGNSIPTPLPSPVSLKKNQFIMRSSSVSTSKDDPDISFSTDDHRPRALSIKSSESVQERPLSVISTTSKPGSSKSRFHFFKEKRNSISLSFNKKSNPSSPTTPVNTDFDDLIRSGNTKKVTLTPNRLRSIEIKEGSHSEAVAATTVPWEKFSTPIKGHSSKKTLRVPPPPPLPVPPLPRMNGPSPPLTPASSVSSYSYQKSKQDELNAGFDMVSLDTQKNSPPTSTITNISSTDFTGSLSSTTTTVITTDSDIDHTSKQSFHKNTITAGSVNVLLPVIIKKSVSTTTEETDDEEDSLFSSNMIYALPEISQTFITNVSKEDKGCQTDPMFITSNEETRHRKAEDEQWLLTNV